MGDAFEPVGFQPGERQNSGVASLGPVGRSLSGADLEASTQANASLDKRFRWALVLYGVLGLLVWFTMGEGKVLVQGRPVELRLVPLIVIGGLVLRTVVAHKAEKIRRSG